MDIKQARGFGCRFLARIDQVDNFLLLRWRELGAATADTAFFADSQEATVGSLAQHGAFELGKQSDNSHHHASGR